MQDWLLSVAAWWGGTALGGGLVLLVGCWLMSRMREPAARQRIGEIAVVAALVVAVARLGPAWLTVPWPETKASAAQPTTLPAEIGGWVILSSNGELGEARTLPADPPPAPPVESSAPLWTWQSVL